MEVEIIEIPPLAPGQQSLLAGHSLLNAYNVLRGELALVGLALADDTERLAGALRLCDHMIAGLREPAQALADAARMGAHEAWIFSEIEHERRRHPARAEDAGVCESLANLRSVFAVLRVHARELLARAACPDRWIRIPVSHLRADLVAMLAAMEKNSKGRYRIVYDRAVQTACDYLLDIRIEQMNGGEVLMPAALRDVLIDLLANARKYTAPGGQIYTALKTGPEDLHLVVRDTGRGIPAEDVPRVVHYGQRARNVGDVRAMGGGFGLTKAFLVTKQLGGRFWIDSTEGVGTSVRLWLPVPRILATGRNPGETKRTDSGRSAALLAPT